MNATRKLEDGHEALVTARVETDGGQLAALLEGIVGEDGATRRFEWFLSAE